MSLELIALAPMIAGRPLFAPLTLRVAPGEIATVMGPSGVGKSALLDVIGGHARGGLSAAGRVRLQGRELTGLPASARGVGVMFQDPLLFPHLSLAENLAFGLPRGRGGRAERRAAVAAALAQAGMAGMEERDPASLSGGQQARAALMRALLAAPRALLLDEPFSKLDAERRAEMRAFVFDHLRARAIPALLVTHDPQDAPKGSGATVRLQGISAYP